MLYVISVAGMGLVVNYVLSRATRKAAVCCVSEPHANHRAMHAADMPHLLLGRLLLGGLFFIS